ncbi:unnamed protein product [Blepharisma stoltei]|uniref:AAA+ ATPase domain-containing protein n=1 Tax=Blepharisma stoltei TaxID=1481888 RepID=A0AAU9IJF1_9CILI|nr:unnamed protein product [Blepharisma stoltei]
MFLFRGLVSLAYCSAKGLDHIQSQFNQKIEEMKREFGTQMMSFPEVKYQQKGDQYSISFHIDKRRGTVPLIAEYIEGNMKNCKLKHKKQTNIRGIESLRYDFLDENNKEYSITLSGPINNYFYMFEYTKEEDGFTEDLKRLSDIYQKANQPINPIISHVQRINHPRYDGRGQRGGDPIENLQNLGALVFLPDDPYYDWDYLAGSEEAKREIEDTILLTLERPEIFDKITQVTRVKDEKNRPRAVLFEGPPGTGKTTSAKIISHQVKIPMVYVRLETIISSLYGEAEKNLGKVFENCQRLGKCVIFIDEIDSLAQSREKEMHEATRRILSVFLRYLDGFESSDDVIVICATNRKEDLDLALQSRFSKVISFPYPDKHSRSAIFMRYARHLTQAQLNQLADMSEGLSGRDIKAVCEDAERKWAAAILRGTVIDNYKVDFSHYLEALQYRIQGYKQ